MSRLIFFIFFLILSTLASGPTGCGGIPAKNGTPQPDDKNFQMAEQSFLQGDYVSASNFYQIFIKNNPRSAYLPESVYRTGLCQISLGEYDQAIATFQEVLGKARSEELRTQVLAGLGQTYMFKGAYEKSALYYQKALRGNTGTISLPEIYFNLGTALMRSGEWQKGNEYFRRLLKLTSEGPLAESAQERLLLPKNIFTVQIAKYRDEKNAQKHLAELNEQKDINASIKIMLINGETFYFIWAGSFSNWDTAKQRAEELREKGIEAMIVP